MALVVRARQLIDGTGNVPLRDGLVAIEGGKITYAGPAAAFDWSAGEHQVIQREGTMLAGLIDAHQHIAWSASTTPLQDFLGVDDRLGTLETGKQADLIVVEGDPLQDITAVGKVCLVVKAGHVARG